MLSHCFPSMRLVLTGNVTTIYISRFSMTLAAFATHAPLESRRRVPPRNPFPYPEHDNPTPQQIFHLPFGATPKQIKSRYYELVRVHHPDATHAMHLSPELAHDRFRSIKAAYDFLCGRTLSPHPNSKPAPTPRHFDPYLHELAQRRRAHYASRRHATGEEGTAGEGWAKPGWADGFGAPKDQQGEWNENGWRERLILSFGVVILLAGLFPTLPFTISSMFLSISPTSSLAAPVDATPSLSHNFLPDIHKNHRAAVSSLVQAREERREVGMERREGVRQRVREMNEIGLVTEDDEESKS